MATNTFSTQIAQLQNVLLYHRICKSASVIITFFEFFLPDSLQHHTYHNDISVLKGHTLMSLQTVAF